MPGHLLTSISFVDSWMNKIDIDSTMLFSREHERSDSCLEADIADVLMDSGGF